MVRFLALFFILVSIEGLSQDDYMDKITQQSCDCVTELKNQNIDHSFVERLGFCIMQSAEPFRAELQRDHNIDWDQIHIEGKRLGQLIGVKMMSRCPSVLIWLTNKAGEMKHLKTDQVETFSGKIVKAETTTFLVLHIRDSAGKVNRFYWLEFVESEVDLEKIEKLTGRNAEVSFVSRELFDPKTREYRKFSVLKKLNVTD